MWLTQHTATHCHTLQHAATHCNTLQHTVPCACVTHSYLVPVCVCERERHSVNEWDSLWCVCLLFICDSLIFICDSIICCAYVCICVCVRERRSANERESPWCVNLSFIFICDSIIHHPYTCVTQSYVVPMCVCERSRHSVNEWESPWCVCLSFIVAIPAKASADIWVYVCVCERERESDWMRESLMCMPAIHMCHTGWLRLVGSLKLLVSFAKEPYKRDCILQKRPIILRSLLIVATP